MKSNNDKLLVLLKTISWNYILEITLCELRDLHSCCRVFYPFRLGSAASSTFATIGRPVVSPTTGYVCPAKPRPAISAGAS